MDDLLFRAAKFASESHRGQVRKYHGGPYIEHPFRVASRVLLEDAATPAMVAAAYLHDVVEDCDVEPEVIADLFGMEVAQLVNWLTNRSKSPAYASLPRAARKKIDREFLAEAPVAAQIIKAHDRIDNLLEMPRDIPFARLYAEESWELLVAIAKVPTALFRQVRDAIERLEGGWNAAQLALDIRDCDECE